MEPLGSIVNTSVWVNEMATQQYSMVHIALAAGVILLAFMFRSRGERRKFRWLFLTGHAGLGAGMIASGFTNVWIVGGVFALWFPIAVYFIVQERKERREGKGSGLSN